MFSLEDRMRAVQLYIQYYYSPSAVIHELGYPSRGMLYNWHKEYKATGTLRGDDGLRHTKYTKEQRKQAVGYYREHGRSISRTIRALGFPGRTVLREWVSEDLPEDKCRRPCKTNGYLVRGTLEQKEQAVIDYGSGTKNSSEISKKYGIYPNTIYKWREKLLGKDNIPSMPKKNTKLFMEATAAEDDEISRLCTERAELEQNVKVLREENFCLQLQNDILEKAGELLKKDPGVSLEILTNREKAALIDALRNKYRLHILLEILHMAKSSYCYQEAALHKPDKYADLSLKVQAVFNESKGRYGYRRIHAIIIGSGYTVSEKVIRHIMAGQDLVVHSVQRKKYSSCQGEISPEVENIVNRDFRAEKPNMKWLTDITEFRIPAGKIYLSPIIDCFDGLPVSWSIGTAPIAELVNSRLDLAVLTLQEGEKPIVHSDRGAYYRWPGWI